MTKILSYQTCFPDMGQNDYFLFSNLKKRLQGRRCYSNKEIKWEKHTNLIYLILFYERWRNTGKSVMILKVITSKRGSKSYFFPKKEVLLLIIYSKVCIPHAWTKKHCFSFWIDSDPGWSLIVFIIYFPGVPYIFLLLVAMITVFMASISKNIRTLAQILVRSGDHLIYPTLVT